MSRLFVDLLPVSVPGAPFLLGIPIYVARCVRRGVPRDGEMEARGGSALIGLHVRHYFVWLVSPLWRLLLATGIRADTVTLAAALLGGGGAIAVAVGSFGLGGALTLGSGMLDALDGRLARFRGQASHAGAALDSVLDRYVDFALLAGLGWFYRGSPVLLAVLLAMLGTFVVPYVRAKGEALHVPVAGGLMARPERVVVLGVAVAGSPLFELLVGLVAGPPHPLAALGVSFVALASNITPSPGSAPSCGACGSRPGGLPTPARTGCSARRSVTHADGSAQPLGR